MDLSHLLVPGNQQGVGGSQVGRMGEERGGDGAELGFKKGP